MGEATVCEIDRFRVPLDRAYHRTDHTWVRVEGDLVRVGLDALGVETAGDLAQIIMKPPGTALEAGDEMGSIEAQKFVGDLRSPVSGDVVEVNARALDDPRLVQEDPYGEGWLLILRPSEHPADVLAGLIAGEGVRDWFAAELDRYRREGSVAG
ncbi:MAG TPA: glycine cleavage system protein H [Actinomycetota bacterium]|jgi:glycine cleavage system H protein